MEEIKFLIESKNGHDEYNVPENKVAQEVTKHLADDKWAVVEKTDGNSEVLTKTDIPQKESEPTPAWKNVFNTNKSTAGGTPAATTVHKPVNQEAPHIRSITCTHKAKGG
jgi:hypothetical protein